MFVQPMSQATAKNFNVDILTSCVRSFNPHDISGKNIHPNLIPQSTFPFKLERRKRVSWDGWTLLWDAHISAIHTDEAVIQTATIFPTFENNLDEIYQVSYSLNKRRQKTINAHHGGLKIGHGTNKWPYVFTKCFRVNRTQ
jgi:hypothetical protein